MRIEKLFLIFGEKEELNKKPHPYRVGPCIRGSA